MLLCLPVLLWAAGAGRAQEPAPAPPEGEPSQEASAPAGSADCGEGSRQEAPPDCEGETRAVEWTRRRQAQFEQREPYRPGWLERNILALEKAERPSLFSWNLFGLYPRVQGIARGSQNAVGVRFWQPDIKGSRWDVHASAFYSLTGYEFYDVQLGRIAHPRTTPGALGGLPLRSTKGDDVFELGALARRDAGGFLGYLSARYQHYTRLNFFGEGPVSRRQDETSFLHQDALYEAVVGYQLGRHLVLTGRAGYLQEFVGRGESHRVPSIEERFDDTSAPGLSEQPDFWKLTSTALLDLRDIPGNPKRGGTLAIEYSRFRDRGSGAHSFQRFAVDARWLLPLGSTQRRLALRSYLVLDHADRGARVPFYLQASLGGSHTLRGFRNFRFRGNAVALLQAEYRWEPIPAAELALFTDAGTVADSRSELRLADLQADWGVGLRFKTYRAFLFRFEWAKSHEESRFYLRFSSAW